LEKRRIAWLSADNKGMTRICGRPHQGIVDGFDRNSGSLPCRFYLCDLHEGDAMALLHFARRLEQLARFLKTSLVVSNTVKLKPIRGYAVGINAKRICVDANRVARLVVLQKCTWLAM